MVLSKIKYINNDRATSLAGNQEPMTPKGLLRLPYIPEVSLAHILVQLLALSKQAYSSLILSYVEVRVLKKQFLLESFKGTIIYPAGFAHSQSIEDTQLYFEISKIQILPGRIIIIDQYMRHKPHKNNVI